MPKCQACQAPLKGIERFCGNCGAACVAAQPSQPSAQTPSPPPAASTSARHVFTSSPKVEAPPNKPTAQTPSQPPAAPPSGRYVFISSPKVEAPTPRRDWSRVPLGGVLVALIAIGSPLLFKALNRPPELTPQDCIRSILKVNGVDVFTSQKERILDRIASMNCGELNAMVQDAMQNDRFNTQKYTLSSLEFKNATVLADAMKLRASLAGCQVTTDGGYAEPSTEVSK